MIDFTNLTQRFFSKSFGARFAVTLVANGMRGALSYTTGLLVARTLGPAEFGNFIFLLGAFTAVKQLLDMGSSNAFFTFISQKKRPAKFYTLYFFWLVFQFLFVVLSLLILFPKSWITHLWLGQDRWTLLLSFAATFFSLQIWQTISYIGEAGRETAKVQTASAAVAALHLGLVLILMSAGKLSVVLLFSLIVLEYSLMIPWAWRYLGRENIAPETEPVSIRGILAEYRQYCGPLIFYCWVSFGYQFLDRWFLQNYAGAIQQGFYGVSEQFCGISALAANSIVKIFWKETSEAHGCGHMERLKSLYHQSSRLLFFLAAAISGLLIPWTSEIIALLLGPSYVGALLPFTIMLFYPIYQSLGQITNTLFYSLGQTRKYVVLGIAHMLTSIIVAFILLAPREKFALGLGAGALGLAIKMVLMAVIFVNLQDWTLSRTLGWEYRWSYQLTTVGVVIPLGFGSVWIAKLITSQIFFLNTLIAPAILSAVIYVSILVTVLMYRAQIIGLESSYFQSLIRPLLKAGKSDTKS